MTANRQPPPAIYSPRSNLDFCPPLAIMTIVQHHPTPPSTPRRVWSSLSPNQQIGYGCLTIAVIGSLVMYCIGTFSLLIRPSLIPRPPTPTVITRTTGELTPTQPPPTFINPPAGTLLPTPTQAPIPTRELPSPTPTPEVSETLPITGTLAPVKSPTRATPTRLSGTAITTPRP